MGNLISLCEDCHEKLHNIVADTINLIYKKIVQFLKFL